MTELNNNNQYRVRHRGSRFFRISRIADAERGHCVSDRGSGPGGFFRFTMFIDYDV